MSSTSNHNNNTSSSTVRVDYSKYVADITGSPKAVRQSVVTGIGHHINPISNSNPSRQSQSTQQQQAGMPQYGGGNEKCARCSKTVYIAEKKVGAGRPFHISCFSCHTCHRKLDSTVLSEHKGEIYCKACYTKQFGAHGLISGVTMSTEQTTGRRPSYGNDLDVGGTTYPPVRHRTSSNENIIYDERFNRNSQSPIKYSQRTDHSPSPSSSRKSSDGINAVIDTQYQRSSSSSQRNSDGINAVVDTQYQRSSSSSSSSPQKTNNVVNAVVDATYRRSSSPTTVDNSNIHDQRHRSTYIEEDDRSKYAYEGEKISYGNGTSAVVNIPVISQTKQSNTNNNGYDIPIERTGSYQRNDTRSPSNDSYRRQSSRERQIDITDDYARMNVNDDTTRKHSTDFTLNVLPSENPSATRSYQSSYQTRYSSTSVNSNSPNREQSHSRESSPISTINRYQSSSPITTGYVSSSTTRSTTKTYQSGVSPSRTYTTQYEHHSSGPITNPNVISRRSPSPLSNDRASSGLTDFISKTNLAGNIPSSNSAQTSTLSALANGFRPVNRADDDDDN